jgi:hypothetical protein
MLQPSHARLPMFTRISMAGCLTALALGACAPSSDEDALRSRGAPVPDGVRAELRSDLEVSREKLQEHVEILARAPRDPGSEQLEAARSYCADQLAELGFAVQTQEVDGGSGRNTIGTLLGNRRPSQQVVVAAHIDSVASCNGADDNASGVAGVLEAARVLAQEEHARTLVVACWDLEEPGLVGSLAYATTAGLLLADVRVAFVLEMIGFKSTEPNSQRLPVSADLEPEFASQFPDQYQQYVDGERRGDFIALIADAPLAVNFVGSSSYVAAFSGAANAVELKSLALELSSLLMLTLPDTTRSDHAAFWAYGYSAIMITDTANLRNPHYHCAEGGDDVETLDFDFATQVTQATVGAATFALNE